ncbi:MAG: serine/threonine-protein kinase [Deltaproteobacteria bacterium]
MQAAMGGPSSGGTGMPSAASAAPAERGAAPGSAAGVAPTVRYSPSGRFAAPDPADLAPCFLHLEILELLGQGGMGAVYKARQRQLNRIVALKILPSESAADPAFAERFSREAQALAQLNHPHIVAVHEFGQANGLYYFVMEFVDGSNLRRLLESGHIAPREALAIVPQICDALQYAHEEGVVHRDIKPENILIDRKGRVKIADFGLAKLLGRTQESFLLTGTHQVMGTPNYIAPEQMERPLAVDHRADIYSLGVVFYEMLTGELPLGRFAPPSKKVQVDVRLDDVVLRSLEKEPERRYQHASEIKNDVERISAASAAAVPPPVPPPPRVPQAAVPELSVEQARAQVRGPAIALLVTGVIHCVSFGLVLLAVFAYLFLAVRDVPTRNFNDSSRGYSRFSEVRENATQAMQRSDTSPQTGDGLRAESNEELRDSSPATQARDPGIPDGLQEKRPDPDDIRQRPQPDAGE